jgi:CheY-like chemotaxis protein
MLEALGFRVGEGVHGLDALWQVAAMRPRLLLIDLDMPEMDGVLATRALVGMPEPYGGLVIVAVSSAGPDRCRQALEAGAAAVLRKPLDVEALQVHLAHAPTDTVAEPV